MLKRLALLFCVGCSLSAPAHYSPCSLRIVSAAESFLNQERASFQPQFFDRFRLRYRQAKAGLSDPIALNQLARVQRNLFQSLHAQDVFNEIYANHKDHINAVIESRLNAMLGAPDGFTHDLELSIPDYQEHVPFFDVEEFHPELIEVFPEIRHYHDLGIRFASPIAGIERLIHHRIAEELDEMLYGEGAAFLKNDPDQQHSLLPFFGAEIDEHPEVAVVFYQHPQLQKETKQELARGKLDSVPKLVFADTQSDTQLVGTDLVNIADLLRKAPSPAGILGEIHVNAQTINIFGTGHPFALKTFLQNSLETSLPTRKAVHIKIDLAYSHGLIEYAQELITSGFNPYEADLWAMEKSHEEAIAEERDLAFELLADSNWNASGPSVKFRDSHALSRLSLKAGHRLLRTLSANFLNFAPNSAIRAGNEISSYYSRSNKSYICSLEVYYKDRRKQVLIEFIE